MTMRYSVYGKKGGKKLGEISCDKGAPEYSPDCDEDLKRFIEASILGRDIHVFRDLHDSEANKSAIVAAPIDPGDELFPLALRDFLFAHGYEVRERIAAEEREIGEFLESFPDSREKRDILGRLPDMTHLEKTFILEQLKKRSD